MFIQRQQIEYGTTVQPQLVRLAAFVVLCLLSACGWGNHGTSRPSDETHNPGIHVGAIETFRYWAGGEPSEDTEVLNGQYWSSPHFTKEYVMYLELRTSWAKGFASENGLSKAAENWKLPDDIPGWFTPPETYDVWSGSQGSLYFIDPQTGHMFMYEVQL